MNFILFNPDELRAESVGCYGHPVVETPNIDRLATEGTRFDQCHVQHTVCTPSRCAFMSGLYPHVSGHRTLWHTLRPHEPNLLRYLKAAGYDVQWWGKNDLLSPGSFARSVTASGHPGGADLGGNPRDREDPAYFSFLYDPIDTPVEEHGDYRCVQGAIDYLDAGPTRPFCLYIPISFPHCPYHAHREWHDRYDPAHLPSLRTTEVSQKASHHAAIRKSRGLDALDDSVFRKIQAVYLGMTSYVDWLLGRLLDALERSGHAEDTTVLFFSDHGDWAGDYGLVEKWPNGLDDVLTRVPLVIRSPGGVAGQVVQEQNELFDLMPTVLDLAGIEAKHTHFARTLVPQLEGASGDCERAVYAEGGYDPHELHCFEGNPDRDDFMRGTDHIYYPKGRLQQDERETVCRSVMVRTDSFKLVRRSSGAHELYDLSTDPDEITNRYEDSLHDVALASVREDLEHRLLDWYLTTSDVVPFEEDPRGHSVNDRV